MDIVTAAQFDKDISAKLPSLNVRCGFEAEFASLLPQKEVAGALAYFLANPDATEIDDNVTSTQNKFKVSKNYITSGPTKSYNTWSIESDSTVPTDHIHTVQVELVSPVLTLPDMLHGMRAVFGMMRAKYKGTQRIGGMSAQYYGDDSYSLAMTSKGTGLHITFSIDGVNARAVDVLKLALLIGESHWATYLGREQHSYAVEALRDFDNSIVSAYTQSFNRLGISLNSFALSFVDAYFSARGYSAAKQDTPATLLSAAGALSRKLHIKDAKYSSVHTGKADKGLLEFRLPGGAGYENKYDKISVMAERFAYAFFAAADPSAYQEYYKNKLVRRAMSLLATTKARLESNAVLDIADMAPKIMVAQGNHILALTHPVKGKVYLAWPLTEVGENAYKFDTTKSVSSVTISSVDRESGRTETLFERMGTEPNDCTLYSKSMNHLVHDRDEAPLYPNNYVKPIQVKDIRGSSVTVVSVGTRDTTYFEDRAAVLAIDDSALAELDPGVAAVVSETQRNIEPSNAHELSSFIASSTPADTLALQAKYKDMILSASPSLSVSLLVDPLTPGTLDLAYSASESFTPEMAASVLSSEGVIESAVSHSLVQSSQTALGKERLNKFPLLYIHYSLISYLSAINSDRAANYLMWSFNDMSDTQVKFFVDTISHLSKDIKDTLISLLIGYLQSYHSGALLKNQVDMISAITSGLPDIEAPLSGIEDYLPASRSASFLSELADGVLSNISSPSDNQQVLLDLMKSRWPNMYASLDLVVSQRQVASAINVRDAFGVVTSFRNSSKLTNTALAYLAKEAITRSVADVPEGSDLTELTKLIYQATFAGLLPVSDIPEWAKSESALLIASKELLRRLETPSSATPDAVIDFLPGLKAQLYRDFLAFPAFLGTSIAGRVAGYGAVSHGVSALGEGSASFYAAVQKKVRNWSSSALHDFFTNLYSMLPENLRTVPPAPSVLFDLIAQDVAKMTKEASSPSPNLIELQRIFGSYVKATKGKSKVKVSPLAIEYPTITAPAFTEIQGSFPDGLPEQSRLTPKELASIFGSPTGEIVESGRYNQVSRADLLLWHLLAFSVDQLVELLSCPPPAGKTSGLFGTNVLRSLHNKSSNGDYIIYQLNTNILLAVDKFGSAEVTDSLLATYFVNSIDPYDSAKFYSVGSNVSDIRDYFILAAARKAKENVVNDINTWKYGLDTFVVYMTGIRAESFASKEFVAFYKFLVTNKLVSHHIGPNLSVLLGAYRTIYKSPAYRVALIDSLFAEADKKAKVYQLPTNINREYGYPDLVR